MFQECQSFPLVPELAFQERFVKLCMINIIFLYMLCQLKVWCCTSVFALHSTWLESEGPTMASLKTHVLEQTRVFHRTCALKCHLECYKQCNRW
jgi:hypothetical protein